MSFGQPNMAERFRNANQAADIVRVCEQIGLPIRMEGGLHFIHCPFHNDEGRPNMALYPTPGDKVQYPRGFCFSCKRVASTIDILTLHRAYSASEALAFLEGNLGGGAVARPTPVPPKPKAETKNLRPAVDLAAERLWGKEGIDARGYLERRGLLEIASQYQYGLWWDDATYWSGRLVIPYLTDLSPTSPVYSVAGRTLPQADDRQQHLPAEGVGHAGAGDSRRVSARQVRVDADDRSTTGPKYLYTKGASREPYLWRMVRERVEQDLYVVACEGELDGASVLHASGGAYPVIALGGAGAVGSLAGEVAGITIIYIKDRGEDGANDGHKAGVASLKQGNATVHVLTPPDINAGKKTDMNDMLVAYGVEGMADWLAEQIPTLLYQDERELV